MPRKPSKGKSLAEINPELAMEWHPMKNGKLTAYDVSIGSKHKAWWKCDKADDHEWKAAIADRSNGQGCGICAGRHVVPSTCLAKLNPKLSKEWHPTKNGSLTPNDVTINSGKKVVTEFTDAILSTIRDFNEERRLNRFTNFEMLIFFYQKGVNSFDTRLL